MGWYNGGRYTWYNGVGIRGIAVSGITVCMVQSAPEDRFSMFHTFQSLIIEKLDNLRKFFFHITKVSIKCHFFNNFFNNY